MGYNHSVHRLVKRLSKNKNRNDYFAPTWPCSHVPRVLALTLRPISTVSSRMAKPAPLRLATRPPSKGDGLRPTSCKDTLLQKDTASS